MSNKTGIAADIATYNYGDYILDAIKSLEEQTVKPDVLYIIDDASTDNTEEVLLTKYSTENTIGRFIEPEFKYGRMCPAKHFRVEHWRLKENHGPSYARNVALKK